LKDFYYIPKNAEEIDYQQIELIKKINIQTPLKQAALLNSNNYQSGLFEII
jgi:hypothetical protein